MKTFLVWDNVEKTHYFEDDGSKKLEFLTVEAAKQFREDLLDRGMYPDRPITVLRIDEYIDGKYIQSYL